MAIIDIVKWDTNNHELLVWKFPSEELSTWTQLIVNDSQEAWLVHEGIYEGPYRTGRHILSTENIPLITEALKLPFGGRTPFTSEVWFVTKTEILNLKWGTIEPMQLTDPIYGMLLPVRAFSQYGLKITNGRKLLATLVGTANVLTSNYLNESFRGIFSSKIKSYISDLILKKKIPIFELSSHLEEISDALPQKLNEILSEYGIEIIRFNLISINVPENDASVIELKNILAQKTKLHILGNNYQQVRSFDILENAAGSDGISGAFLGMGAVSNVFGHNNILSTTPPSATTSSNLTMSEKIKILKELAELKNSGILTEEEFNNQKNYILS